MLLTNIRGPTHRTLATYNSESTVYKSHWYQGNCCQCLLKLDVSVWPHVYLAITIFGQVKCQSGY